MRAACSAALDIAQAQVFGVSMGGLIAQELTLRHPEQVERVVLGCTTPGGPSAARTLEKVVDQLIAGLDLATAENLDPALDMIMPLLFPADFIAAHPELRQLMAAGVKMSAPPARETLERTRAGVRDFETGDGLAQVSCPVLIVHGDQDVLTPPENVALMTGKIPHAEL
jgi:3-oxoadipate enol-lactonase